MKYFFIVCLFLLWAISLFVAVFNIHAASDTQWYAGDMLWAEWATMNDHTQLDVAYHYIEKFYDVDRHCELAAFLVYQDGDRATFYVKCVRSDYDTYGRPCSFEELKYE